MRRGDSAASVVAWEGVEIDDLVGQVNGIADDLHRGTSVPSAVAHSSEVPTTTRDKTAVLAWLADRLCWECRLEELRAAKAAELARPSRGRAPP